MSAAFLPALGAPELLILLVVLVLLFGSAKLPKLARSLGEARRELEAVRGDDADDTHGAASSARQPAQHR